MRVCVLRAVENCCIAFWERERCSIHTTSPSLCQKLRTLLYFLASYKRLLSRPCCDLIYLYHYSARNMPKCKQFRAILNAFCKQIALRCCKLTSLLMAWLFVNLPLVDFGLDLPTQNTNFVIHRLGYILLFSHSQTSLL